MPINVAPLLLMPMIVLTALLLPNFSFGNNINVRPQVSMIYDGFKSISERWPNLREMGQNETSRFVKTYLYPYTQEPGRFWNFKLKQFFTHYDSNSGHLFLDYESAVAVANQLLPIIEGENQLDILIDQPGNLYQSFADISLGFLFQLHYLENSDLKHSTQIVQLKKITLRKMAPMFTGIKNVPKIERWNSIYLRLMYFYFAQYPSTAAVNVYNAMYAFLQDPSEVQWQKDAGGNLLFQLTVLCDAVCVSPQVEDGSTAQSSRTLNLEELFDACDRQCGTVGLRGNGFYQTYLRFLEDQRNPKSREIRNKLIFEDFNGFFMQLPNEIDSLKNNPQHFTSIFSNFLTGQFWPFVKNIFSIVFIVWPTYYLTLVLGIVLVSLDREKLDPVTKRKLHSKKFAKAGSNQFFRNSFANPIKNIASTYSGKTDIWHMIGMNLLVFSVTLCLAELREYVGFYGL